MINKEKYKEKVNIFYYDDSTKITNSYLLTNKEIEDISEKIHFSRSVKYEWRCLYIRDVKSYIREIKAHNLLYKLGLFRKHTIDTDLEEEQKFFIKLLWYILGGINV